MRDIPTDLVHRLRLHRQEHVLFGWENLGPPQRMALIAQLAGIDLEQLTNLYAGKDASQELPALEHIAPIPTIPAAQIDGTVQQLGHEALARGEVAALLVAGGQATRLNFNRPKGLFPLGPVSQRTLFQLHADKVFALGRRYGKPVPLLVMTSPATHEETVNYFEEHSFFALGRDNVLFFQQGTMPALDIDSGRILLEKPGVVFSSPNGHGGTLTALSEWGLLDELAARGIHHVFYFQVDNPLVKVADPAFLGQHIASRAEASAKAVEKAYAAERMGVLALINGRCGIIEYSDMPDELRHASDTHGRLVHRAGSPAIHIFDVEFLKKITQGDTRLPFHIARKKVSALDAEGKLHVPATENALKFEMFVFDALPMAEKTVVVESPRDEEFSPVKNESGVDSPDTARLAMSNLAGKWLQEIGIAVPRDDEGNVAVPIEISPRFALDARELAARIWAGRTIDSATYFE